VGSDNIPPHSIEAEQSIIGSIILDGDVINRASKLNSSDFYDPDHKIIWEACLSLFAERTTIDLVTLSDRLTSIGKLEEIGRSSYLIECSETVVSSANIKEHITIVKECSELRRIIKESTNTINKAYKRTEKSKEIISNSVLKLTETCDTESKLITNTFLTMRNSLMKQRVANTHFYPKSPWDGLNKRLLFGFRPGLVVIGGRPGMGKTAVKLNLIHHWLENGVGIYDYSPEMGSEKELDILDILEIPGLTSTDFYKPDSLDNETKQKLKNRWKFYDKTDYWLDDSYSRSFEEIAFNVDLIRKTNPNLKIVCIDMFKYLKEIMIGGWNRETISNLVDRIFQTGKEQGVCYVVLHHLTKAVDKRRPPIPRQGDLLESSAFEGDADLILLCYRPMKYKKEGELDESTWLIIGKQRDQGKYDEQYINLVIESEYKFVEELELTGDIPF
jgi:replicative DNA helicase